VPAGGDMFGHRAPRYRRRLVRKLDTETFVAAIAQRAGQRSGPDAHLDERSAASTAFRDDVIDGLMETPLSRRMERNKLHGIVWEEYRPIRRRTRRAYRGDRHAPSISRGCGDFHSAKRRAAELIWQAWRFMFKS